MKAIPTKAPETRLTRAARSLLSSPDRLAAIMTPLEMDHGLAADSIAEALADIRCASVNLSEWVCQLRNVERAHPQSTGTSLIGADAPQTTVDWVATSLLRGHPVIVVCRHVEALTKKDWHQVVHLTECRIWRQSTAKMLLLCAQDFSWLKSHSPVIAARVRLFGQKHRHPRSR